jgi:hypothetical protein
MSGAFAIKDGQTCQFTVIVLDIKLSWSPNEVVKVLHRDLDDVIRMAEPNVRKMSLPVAKSHPPRHAPVTRPFLVYPWQGSRSGTRIALAAAEKVTGGSWNACSCETQTMKKKLAIISAMMLFITPAFAHHWHGAYLGGWGHHHGYWGGYAAPYVAAPYYGYQAYNPYWARWGGYPVGVPVVVPVPVPTPIPVPVPIPVVPVPAPYGYGQPY